MEHNKATGADGGKIADFRKIPASLTLISAAAHRRTLAIEKEMSRLSTSILGVAISLACTMLVGCGGLTGDYRIVDMDKTLAGISNVPKIFRTPSLKEYKNHIAQRYAGKTLSITKEKPHEFIIPVDLDGSVGGMIRGGWKRGESEDSIMIFLWLSGSAYIPWGEARYDKGKVVVSLVGPHQTVVLYLEKVR